MLEISPHLVFEGEKDRNGLLFMTAMDRITKSVSYSLTYLLADVPHTLPSGAYNNF